MYSDISGFTPEWLKTVGIIGAIVGTVLVVAAITALTCGVGTTILAGTLAGAVIHGAAVGTLIGAGIGIGVGATAGAVGSLVAGEEFGSQEFWSNTMFGTMAGFGVGALIGAIWGGISGYSSYVPSKITGYTQHGFRQAMARDGHGVSPRGILDAVKNPVQDVVRQANGGFRYIGENSVTVLNKAGKIITTWGRSIFWRF